MNRFLYFVSFGIILTCALFTGTNKGFAQHRETAITVPSGGYEENNVIYSNFSSTLKTCKVYNFRDVESITIPDKIIKGLNSYTVTGCVNDEIFSNKPSLKELHIDANIWPAYDAIENRTVNHIPSAEIFAGDDNLTKLTASGYYIIDGMLYRHSRGTIIHTNEKIDIYRLAVVPPGMEGNIYFEANYIPGEAFANCKKITGITYGKNVKDIMGGFINCPKLTTLTVDEENPLYASVDGCVYSKDLSTLYAVAPGITGTFVVPPHVKTIANYAFANFNGLIAQVPESVTTIENNAFSNFKGALYLYREYSNYQFAKNLQSNSLIYADGRLADKIRADLEGASIQVKSLYPYWPTDISTGLDFIQFKIGDDPTTGNKFDGVTIDGVELSVPDENGFYKFGNLKIGSNYTAIFNYHQKNTINAPVRSCTYDFSTLNSNPVIKIGEIYSGGFEISEASDLNGNDSCMPDSFGIEYWEMDSENPERHSFEFKESPAKLLGLYPSTPYEYIPYAVYNGEKYYSEEKRYLSTACAKVTATVESVTQTTAKISYIIEDDGTVAVKPTLSLKEFENAEKLTGLIPGKKYTLYVNLHYRIGDKKITAHPSVPVEFTTKGIDLACNNQIVTPTTLYFKGQYKNGDAKVETETITVANNKYTGREVNINGLEPNINYSVTYTVTAANGQYTNSRTFNIKTKELQLDMLNPKVATISSAILCATTNVSENETGVGFQWRKYEAPESLPSNEAFASVCEGSVEGYVKNLQSTSFYKARAFYKSAKDIYYYTDWITFDPSDFSYFEPTIHTYAATEISHDCATVKAYIMRGSDEIVSQGVCYWNNNKRNAEPQYVVVNNIPSSGYNTILSDGVVNDITISGLIPQTSYTACAFAKMSDGKIYYGNEIEFITLAADSSVGGILDEGEVSIIGYFDATGKRYSTLQRGLNVILYSDGTTKKVFCK